MKFLKNKKYDKLSKEDKFEYFMRFGQFPIIPVNLGSVGLLISILSLFFFSLYFNFIINEQIMELYIEELRKGLELLYSILKIIGIIIFANLIIYCLNIYKFKKEKELFFKDRGIE